MVAEMKETSLATEIEQVLAAYKFPPYAKTTTGKEIAGYILRPRTDGGCNLYYQHVTGEYSPTDTRRARREWRLQSYLGILLDAGYDVRYVPEVGILDDPFDKFSYQQPYIVCLPASIQEPEEPFVWYEDERNAAFNAAPDETRAYIEALESAVKAAIQFRIHMDKPHSLRLHAAMKTLNFLKEGE